MNKKIVFFGNERLVSGLKTTNTPIIRSLLDAGYNIVAIVANHTDSRSRSNRKLEIAAVAEEYSIPLLTPAHPREIIDELIDLQADVAILIAYGRIIPQRIIDIFPEGIINVHPSLLPKYRGPTPIESAILRGDNTTGISIMQLAKEMDAGPVYSQTTLPLTGSETKAELYTSLGELAKKELLESLPRILNGTLAAVPQNHSEATYCHLLQKSDGVLSPTNETAHEAERKVRAFAEFPKTRLTVGASQLIITKAHVAAQQKTPLDAMFSDNNYLVIDELIAPSGKLMSAESYLRGYKA